MTSQSDEELAALPEYPLLNSRIALVDLGRKHWKEHLPEKFRVLKEAGTLEKELAAAADLTLADMDELKATGLNVHEAWQASRELHLLLKEEIEQMPDNPAWDAMVAANRIPIYPED